MNLTTSKDIEHTLSLLDEINHNMSKPQKELMLWHQHLGHAGFRWIQSLMRKPKHEVGDNQESPVLPTKIAATSNCDPTRCPACQLSKAHRRSPKTHRILARPEMEMSIRREDLNPGDCISMDQYQARVPGRLPSTYGKEAPTNNTQEALFLWTTHQVTSTLTIRYPCAWGIPYKANMTLSVSPNSMV